MAACDAKAAISLFQPRPVRPGQPVPLALEAVAEHRLAAPPRAALDPRTRDYQRRILAGAMVLPPQMGRHLELAIGVRLARSGVYWYHPDVPSLLSLRGELRGHEVHSTVVPRTRSWNGPGTAWALYRLPAGPAWSGERLDLALTALLPPGIELEVDAWLYERWRRER